MLGVGGATYSVCQPGANAGWEGELVCILDEPVDEGFWKPRVGEESAHKGEAAPSGVDLCRFCPPG